MMNTSSRCPSEPVNKDIPWVDTRLLASFVAVAEFKHFGKAAEAVHATQPGVSQHIAKLEAELGVRLINRTKRSVELTPAGEIALRHAHIALNQLKKMKLDAQGVASGLAGRLHVGLSPSVIHTDLPSRLGAFKSAHPKVDLVVQVYMGERLRSMLDFGEIDAAISTLPLPSSEFTATQVTWQDMGIALRAGHPLAKRSSLTVAELRDQPFIVVPREQHPANHDALIARFHQLKATVKVAAYETSFQNVLARVALGEGVGFVAMCYALDRPWEVRVVKVRDPELGRAPVYVIARREALTPLIERFIAALPADAPQMHG